MGSRSALIGVENSKPFIAALACPLDLSRSLLFVTPMTVDEKIAGLGLTLPQAAAPVAAYVPAVQAGGLLHISGQLPFDDGQLMTERLGEDRDLDYGRSEEHPSELQSLMRNSYAVFRFKKKQSHHQ